MWELLILNLSDAAPVIRSAANFGDAFTRIISMLLLVSIEKTWKAKKISMVSIKAFEVWLV